jgi:hypothetical protein
MGARAHRTRVLRFLAEHRCWPAFARPWPEALRPRVPKVLHSFLYFFHYEGKDISTVLIYAAKK